jgi:hypothetical protein
MEKITMSEYDLTQASREGVWWPLCPNCETHTPAELDAQLVYCIHCDQLIEIDNPFSQPQGGEK